jgi:peptidyl-prolyl cis-trans isomerase B (cyclophilin B)
VVTKQQRERQLARAKWERQRARRSAHAARIHKLVIAGWAAFGLAVAGLIVWFGATQLGGSSPAPAQAPVLPEVSQPTVFQPPNYSPPPTPSSAPSTTAGSATDRGQR